LLFRGHFESVLLVITFGADEADDGKNFLSKIYFFLPYENCGCLRWLAFQKVHPQIQAFSAGYENLSLRSLPHTPPEQANMIFRWYAQRVVSS
jgi:hypothetical protein